MSTETSAEFRMPSLGADMTEGTVVEWLVGPGDRVRRGDVVAVVDTEKAAIDVECFEDGVVDRLLVQQGQKVAVGTPLALIGSARTEHPEPATAPATLAPEPAGPRIGSPLARKRAEQAGIDLATIPGSGPGGLITRADVENAVPPATARPPSVRARISPYARRLATERGIDPATLTASSPNGTVHARDLPPPASAAPPAPAPTFPPPPEIPLTLPPEPPGVAQRRATAALMARSKREIPHYYLSQDIDMGRALDWLRGHNRAIPVTARVLPAAVLLRAVALAARAVPELNGHWVDDGFRPGDGVHLGVAVSVRGGGLVVPVVRDADTLGLDELMAAVRGAAERARGARLRSSEAGGATLTVTNLGELGVDTVHGVIHPPQVALVGFGAVRRRPWADDTENTDTDHGSVTVRPVVTATLSADHRATDGATGARLLHHIARCLHRPEEL
ncbi:dihydrolipoamide acetyltransferase family protein [Pseudonocardia acaciae]|uniref:dihydrolipoamide acetyltransferase family protein n=1 Tax=Pseudonocardia acaciae TaxID=551276 RepID=UPI00056C8B7E|nr:dihydrolipoamide acetyltransferase family protein [Pseudonocardia acaciae]